MRAPALLGCDDKHDPSSVDGMTTTQIPTYELNDGTSVPVIGFGTHPLTGEEGVAAMVGALEAGYRYLDSAVNYGNEEEVGEAVRRIGARPATRSRSRRRSPDGSTSTTSRSRPSRTRSAGCASTYSTSASSTGPTRASGGSPRRGRPSSTSASAASSGRSA